jgi:HAD superfamily hydrolase (TIGR01484 family)
MNSLSAFSTSTIATVFTDIDDTLTDEGTLRPEAYASLWQLHDAGIKIVPVTGRPAGWCEMIARFWPVHGVIGENGGFYFRYDGAAKKMIRHFVVDEKTMAQNREKLEQIRYEVVRNVRGSAVASDQFSRLMDLAIDFCEDVKPLPESDVTKIVEIFEKHGAVAKVSSIHVNGWFGQYDKLSMTKIYCERELGFKFENQQSAIAFCGDSPNDEPMFQAFKNSFAVANIKNFANRLKHQPAYVSDKTGGHGFVQIANRILELKT